MISTHGFFPEDGTTRYELRFGFAALVGFIWTNQLDTPGHTRKVWPFRPIDRGFVHLQQAIRDLVWKLERSASEYDRAARRFSESVDKDESGHYEQLDLSIHLDSVIVYLRVLADTVAQATPYLYPSNAGDIGRRSFRTHIKWFENSANCLDIEYADLLRKYTGWFDLLAGKDGKGIRDLIMHRFARFQHPIVTGPPSLRGRVGSDLIIAGDYVTDAHLLIARSARGLCEFLDNFVLHHARRIDQAAGWSIMDVSRPRAGYMMTFESLPGSSWLLPVQLRRADA